MNLKGFHRKLLTGILSTVFLFLSCSKESYNIVWSGVLLDAETSHPIPFTNIQTKAVYQLNIDHSEEKKINLITDESGNFSCLIKKAYLVSVFIENSRYQSYTNSFHTNKETLPDTLFLQRSEQSSNLFLSINEDGFDHNTPFISQKAHYTNLNQKQIILTEQYGFDFINKQRNVTTFDLSLNLKKVNSKFDLELLSAEKGGILPIYKEQISDSFFLEMEIAPSFGYQKNYNINGKEAGFFVKCRDGKHFAKVIFQPQLYKLNCNSEQDSLVEQGLKFSYILQKDTIHSRYFPTVAIIEQLNEQQLTSIKNTIKGSNQ
ncbi:hypothetical protein [Carboxylicivirga caseinilyticus]|uniref:hypothetical protein n=1 Tax=Carboxylicivirga caseinilyticus TaxID=3417572 RepID=UPI003D359858|nr:hypothetical protein [Marinilabiliaceae bacterium A049]